MSDMEKLVLPIFLGTCAGVILVTVVANLIFKRSNKSTTEELVEVVVEPKKPKKSKKLVTLKDPHTKYSLPLIEKEEISHDTRRFRFGLPSPNHVLGLPIGQHIFLSAMIDDEIVVRAYTPITSDLVQGYVDLVIKIYFKGADPNYPDGGKMTQYLEKLQINDRIDVRGPSGKLQYTCNGSFLIKKRMQDPPTKVVTKKINMIAGGSGVAPMVQLIRHICEDDPSDPTEIRLLYGNRREVDILMRSYIDRYATEHPHKFKAWFTLSRATKSELVDWKYSTGHVNEQMMRDHLFPPGEDVLTLMCGPQNLLNLTCKPALDKIGYTDDRRFEY